MAAPESREVMPVVDSKCCVYGVTKLRVVGKCAGSYLSVFMKLTIVFQI